MLRAFLFCASVASTLYDDPSQKKIAQLSDKTLCMVALQGNDRFRHYDVHSLYGYSQALPTLNALRIATRKRGLVLSRSTFPGGGRWAGHWLGDNSARWSHLRQSVVGTLEFNLFGFPFVGADMCGFFGETNNELCTRWMQLGAFYPFSRNHNVINAKDQDPGSFPRRFLTIMRRAMLMRYRLLPFFYSQFVRVRRFGGTVVRPLFFEFPHDKITLKIQHQFMWGSSVLISPILNKNQKKLRYYLPGGNWYRMTDSSAEGFRFINLGDYQKQSSGYKEIKDLQLESPTEVHVREGHVLFTKTPRTSTKLLTEDPFFHIIVALDSHGSAVGELYWDDGESIDDELHGIFHGILKCRNLNCVMSVKENNYRRMEAMKIGVVTFLGTVKTKCEAKGLALESSQNNNVLKCNFRVANIAMNEPLVIKLI